MVFGGSDFTFYSKSKEHQVDLAELWQFSRAQLPLLLGAVNYCYRPDPAQSPHLQHKLYLNTATPTQFCIVYNCFHTTMTELNSCDMDNISHKAENIYYVLLYRESLCNLLQEVRG